MKTEKLTLRLEGELIERAKLAARERGTSVSRMVAGFFESIEEPGVSNVRIANLARSHAGCGFDKTRRGRRRS